MKQAAERGHRFLPADAKSSKVLESANRALDRPAPLVAAKGTTVLCLVLRSAVGVVRRDKLNTLLGRFLAQAIAVLGLVADEALGITMSPIVRGDG